MGPGITSSLWGACLNSCVAMVYVRRDVARVKEGKTVEMVVRKEERYGRSIIYYYQNGR